MFCSNCGTKNENGSAFCSNCGNKLGKNKPVNTPKQNSNIVDKIKENKVVAIIVVVVVGFIGYKLLSPNKLVCKQKYNGETATIEITYKGNKPTKIYAKTSDGAYDETITVKNGKGYDKNGDESDLAQYSTFENIIKKDKSEAKNYLIDNGYDCK